MDWDDIKIFLALMRSGTVRGAAEQLRVSHSTVARRIDALEQKMEVRLFERLPSGYALTPVGEDMLAVAEDVETEIQGLERRIIGHDHKLSGTIKITMVDALATGFLMPHLTEFTQSYPDIDLEVDTTYQSANLDHREADIALRFASNPPEHLIGRRLVTCALAAYASRDYLARNDLHDPESGRWIGYGSGGNFPKWVRESAYPKIPAKGKFLSLLVQLSACKAGMGVGILPCFLAEQEANLRRLTAAKPNSRFELWLLTHKDMRTNARIRVFADFLATTIRNHRSQFEATDCLDDPGISSNAR